MKHNDLKYIFRDVEDLEIQNSIRNASFDSELLEQAVVRANEMMFQVGNFEINIFEVLGMRNLSAFVGEVFAKSVSNVSEGLFVSNPHQDGYPDLLLMDDTGKKQYDSLLVHIHDKGPFSPFPTGGIEVKATVGSVPSPTVLAKKGLLKPQIGEQRIDLLNGYDWKAHHRETNNLLSILWDFIDGVPIIVAVFYSSNLLEEDWGKIIHPKEGGGRTTSVSIMASTGILKMYQGWLCVIDDDRYINYLNKKNKQTLIKR